MFESGTSEGPPPASLEVLKTQVAEVHNFPDFVKTVRELGRIETTDGENKVIVTADELLNSVGRFCKGVRWESGFLAELGVLGKVQQLLAAYREKERATATAQTSEAPQERTALEGEKPTVATGIEEAKNSIESFCSNDLARLRGVLSEREQSNYTAFFNESAGGRIRTVTTMLSEAVHTHNPEKLGLALRAITNTFNDISSRGCGVLRDDPDSLNRLKQTLRIVSENLSAIGGKFSRYQDVQQLEQLGYEAKAAANACQEAALTVGRFAGRLQQR